MTISTYIAELEKIRKEHGELPVDTDGMGGRQPAVYPEVAYRKLLKPRESRPGFWYGGPSGNLDPERRGEKVVRI